MNCCGAGRGEGGPLPEEELAIGKGWETGDDGCSNMWPGLRKVHTGELGWAAWALPPKPSTSVRPHSLPEPQFAHVNGGNAGS